jgi:hypothetical protein
MFQVLASGGTIRKIWKKMACLTSENGCVIISPKCLTIE